MGEGRTQTNSEEVDTRPCGGGVGGRLVTAFMGLQSQVGVRGMSESKDLARGGLSNNFCNCSL